MPSLVRGITLTIDNLRQWSFELQKFEKLHCVQISAHKRGNSYSCNLTFKFEISSMACRYATRTRKLRSNNSSCSTKSFRYKTSSQKKRCPNCSQGRTRLPNAKKCGCGPRRTWSLRMCMWWAWWTTALGGSLRRRRLKSASSRLSGRSFSQPPLSC